MKVVKKTSEYTITQRRDGRYAVVDSRKNPVNGEEKVKILVAEELLKLSVAAPEPEPEVEEAAPEEEAAAEETPAAEESTEETK